MSERWIIEVLKNTRGKWYIRIKSRNGLIVFHANGKGYSSKWAAEKTAHSFSDDTWNARVKVCGI